MATPQDPTQLREGDFLGPYRIVSPGVPGRHWTVYVARSGGDRRQVALKVLRGTWAVPGDVLQRARQALGLEHPNVARLFDAGEDRGLHYVAEELILDQRGAATSLATELLNHGNRLPEERVRVLAKQLFDAVGALHGADGGPFAHGHIDAGNILLNTQRRAKLINAGLYVSPGRSAETTDHRALGALLTTALTGTNVGSGATPPSQHGVNPRWDRVIRQLTEATDASHPDLAALAEEILSIDDTPHPLRRWLLPLAAACLLIPGILLSGLFVKVRREHRESARLAAAAQVAAAREATVEALLRQARTEQDAGNVDAAHKTLLQAAQEAPGHAGVTRALANLTMQTGLARIAPVKSRAEAAWAGVREVPTTEGFGTLLAQLKATMTAARNALAEQAFEQAQMLYVEAEKAAVELSALDTERTRAAAGRQQSDKARDGADGHQAATLATLLWDQAQTREQDARQAFEGQRFTDAKTQWREAAELYTRAAKHAQAALRVSTARNAYEAALAAAGDVARQAMPEAIRDRVAALNAEAERLLHAEEWFAAASLWDQALEAFHEGVGEADARLREQHFEEALARGMELATAQQLLGAEQALTEALRVKGYENESRAKGLLLKIRAQQEKIGGGRPRTKGNLVRNGDFSEGTAGVPLAWTRPDNLTVFWEDGGVSGRCLRMDTDVYRNEWEEHRKHPDIPMKKTPTSGTRYDTVGGTTGVAVYSYPIPVQPGAYYRVRYDIRGQGEPFVYVKGYWKAGAEHLKDMGEKIFFKPVPGGPSFSLVAYGTSGEEKRQPRPGDFIQSFRRRVVARLPADDTRWRRFETVFQLPPDRPIQLVLLELYAFWPPGETWFDTITMEEVTKDDLDAYEAQRQTLGEKVNFGTILE